MYTQSVAEILKKVRRIEISSRIAVSEMFSGEYHSRFRGQGLEFAEVREYQPGDNHRDIDWNVSARRGQLYVKKYQETRELRVVFLVDISSSLNMGTQGMFKRERVAELVAGLSFSAVANHDLVGMIMFSDKPEKYIPPRKGKNNAMAILRDILFYQGKGRGTSIKVGCEYANRMLAKRCIIFVISDWLDEGFQPALKVLARKHDVVALQILDSSELALPDAGILHLRDPETGSELWFNSSEMGLRKRYETAVNKKQEELKAFFRKCRCDYLQINTQEPYLYALQKFFRLRGKRRGR